MDDIDTVSLRKASVGGCGWATIICRLLRLCPELTFVSFVVLYKQTGSWLATSALINPNQ